MALEIRHSGRVSSHQLPAEVRAAVYFTRVRIPNPGEYGQQLVVELADTSWVAHLEPIPRAAYADTVQRTVDKLLAELQREAGQLASELGEYLVSTAAGKSLAAALDHIAVPIAELWKEKISGNPGFDFHTETRPRTHIAFGEAKYSSSRAPYPAAADQALAFIAQGKHREELIHLTYLVSATAVSRLLEDGRFGIALAFSVTTGDDQRLLARILAHAGVMDLSRSCDELFLIGVEI